MPPRPPRRRAKERPVRRWIDLDPSIISFLSSIDHLIILYYLSIFPGDESPLKAEEGGQVPPPPEEPKLEIPIKEEKDKSKETHDNGEL